MFCPSCNTRNQPYNNYCYYCGYKLKENKDKIHEYKLENLDTSLDTSFSLEDEHTNQEDLLVENDSFDDFDNIDNIDSTYDYFLKDDNLVDIEDNLFNADQTSELDLTTQMPLRRYKKDKSSYKRKKAINKILTLIVLVALAVLAILAGMQRFGNRDPHSSNMGQSIAVSSSVEETTIQDKKAYRIVFNTVNGTEISFLGEVLEVENGRTEFIVEESLLYSYNPELNEDGLYVVHVDAIISSPNLSDVIERVSITLSPPYNYAPFNLLQPSTSETEFQGDTSKVSFKILPESEVFINEQDFTDLVTPDGRFEKEFSIPSGQDELILNIRVSTPGFLDNIQQIILRKSPMDVLFTINESSPISSKELWVKISGTVDPEATIEADLEIFEEPEINRDTGEFTLYVKAERPGYTLCNLTAKLNGKESSIEVILERETDVHTYTSTAWKPVYNDLQRDEKLSNGRHFVFSGSIKEIIETGDRNVFIVDISEEQSDLEELFYVEYWGSFDFSIGDSIRVFANRWGNKDGIPRFLAKYIYEG